MKKIILFIIIVVCLALPYVYSETVVYHTGESELSSLNYCYIYEVDGDVNDFSADIDIGKAYLERIVIDANGTDTSFKLYIYDTTTTYGDVAVWSKTDLTTASDPYSYAITMASIGTQEICGVPVSGDLTITLADGDDATLNGLEIYIYYRRD